MTSMTSLNPTLFAALTREFGQVKLSNAGAPMLSGYIDTKRSGELRTELQVADAGEYLRVNCPFCNDLEFRLYINHRWGVFDNRTKTANRWLAHCFNENCLADEANREELECRTASYRRRAKAGRIVIQEPLAPPDDTPIPLPNDFRRLDELAATHPARKYLQDRKFDPDNLAERWGVGYSRRPFDKPSAHGRLIIPVEKVVDGDLQPWGWQARQFAVEEELPKYHTAKGLRKSELLYGLQRVDSSDSPVLILEGVTDVWRARKNALAIFGKSASPRQVQLICRRCFGRPVVVMLDEDAAAEATELAEKIRAGRKAAVLRPDDSPVVVVRFKGSRDPADRTYSELWAIVERALNR